MGPRGPDHAGGREALTDPLLTAAAGLLALALLAALLHLGRARAARFAVSHVGPRGSAARSCWGRSSGPRCAWSCCWGARPRAPALGGALAPLTALLGLVFVYAISGSTACAPSRPGTRGRRPSRSSRRWCCSAPSRRRSSSCWETRGPDWWTRRSAPWDRWCRGRRPELVVMVLHLRRLARAGGVDGESARVVQQAAPGTHRAEVVRRRRRRHAVPRHDLAGSRVQAVRPFSSPAACCCSRSSWPARSSTPPTAAPDSEPADRSARPSPRLPRPPDQSVGSVAEVRCRTARSTPRHGRARPRQRRGGRPRGPSGWRSRRVA